LCTLQNIVWLILVELFLTGLAFTTDATCAVVWIAIHEVLMFVFLIFTVAGETSVAED
jgi:hypothetical protein